MFEARRVETRDDRCVVDLQEVEFRYPKFRLGPLSLRIRPGAAVALVGPNGAGKTTLLGILSGHRAISAGSARILGKERDRVDPTLREHVAILPTQLLGLRWMSVGEHFDFLSHFYSGWDMAKAREMAKRLDLRLADHLRALSRGQSLKVSLCAALAQGAKLLLFDEPTAGLDPVARHEALQHILSYTRQFPDVAVVFATHILEDLDEIPFTCLLVLREGKALNPSGDGALEPSDAGIRETAKRRLLGAVGR
ncbi:ATP-binding cassette domain-containing protein [Candidatus Palauibacter sp.]|uniref:ATP-binding cassette domain-containing protein n=1 Tax=Candidatus Palauibacter sp. TaxID=3101350 RepID=UPI003D104ACD